MDKAPEELKHQYERAIDDYLTMRMAGQEEQHIMDMNRVGVEKNMKNIIK